MNVVISPNIKKSTARIDLEGNEIDPRTKQVITPVEKPYMPTAEELSGAVTPTPAPEKKADSFAEKISTGSSEIDAKIEEKVAIYRKELIEKAKAALDNI